MSGIFFALRNLLPEPKLPRWYKARTISGKPAGLGFYCDKCHLHIRYGAEAGVRHCGGVENPPIITALLPTRSLGPNSNDFPDNLIPVGWDDDKETYGNRPIFGA